jgi:hypothetical protein
MKLAKVALPTGSTLGDIMRALSERWKASGPDVDQVEHEEYWREMAISRLGLLSI